VRLDVAYDGSGFRGWARQRGDVRTVQGTLEQALSDAIGAPVQLSVAGRTDAGVHASGQVASFSLLDEATAGRIDLAALRRRVNARVGPEVIVLGATWAPAGFDARFSASARIYRYRLDTGDVPDPFTSRVTWHRSGPLRLTSIRAAARHLVGEHEFASFCRSPGSGTTVRRIDRITVTREGDVVEIRVRANAFCHQMVRALVGTLVAAGAGTLDPDEVPAILAARDRHAAPPIAPPQGLTLERVVFGSPRRR
jgi:tRNA pseudouridine38-40 synthase